MAKNRKYKRNYLDSLKSVIPGFYFEEDYSISGYQRTATDDLINSHINFCINQPTIFGVSATENFSDIGTVSGFGRWFVPQNNLTDVNSRDFELDIMHPLGYCVGEYTGQKCAFFTGENSITDFSSDQKTTFTNFLKSTLLPKLHLNASSLADTTASAFSNTASGTHEYLLNGMGWAYILNTSGQEFSPSSYVASAVADIYFENKPFNTIQGVYGLTEYVWRNWPSLSGSYPGVLPVNYTSGVTAYTSGTQELDALKSLVNIVYNSNFLTNTDTYIKDSFSNYVTNGDLLEGQEPKAPFSRFLQALSYSFFDTNTNVTKISTITDIEKCPDNLLPYLSDLIGWKLYGSNPDSWRRQLRGAATLYKQKGTKEGVFNAITTVLPTVDMEMSSISEFNESYIPNLLYYLLKTDTTLFDSFESFNFKKAQDYIYGDYSESDMDENIRKVIDWMLARAAYLYFPDLFYVKNFKFDLHDPKFKFYYRGRPFVIPPWEEERFYTNCEVTNELLAYFERELICLGVSESNANAFREYVATNTVKGDIDTKFYNNGFFFLTSSVNNPPNMTSIVDNFEVAKYDYIPLWNGKSSHFDVNVSSGTFDASFFQGKDFLKQDFFQSLAVIDAFSPAKSIPRIRVNLDNIDQVSSLDYTCPSLRYWIYDLPVSGALAGSHSSGVDFRGIPGAFGSDYPTPPNSGRAQNDHSNLPVFGRPTADNPLDKVNLIGSSIDQPPLSSDVFRNAMRRRNFEKSSAKGGLYERTGFNMPTYFNTSSAGSDVEYQPLGLLNLLFNKYHKVVNPLDLFEVSSFPYNLDIWSKCWDLNSDNDMSGIYASSTFDIRGSTDIQMSTCHNYVARERTPEFYNTLRSVYDQKLDYEANYIADKNKFLLNVSSFLNGPTAIKNTLFADREISNTTLYNTILGGSRFSVRSLRGIEKTFKDYINYYSNYEGLGYRLLHNKDEGGPNVISHAYGPLLYNSHFTLEGSGADVSSSLISKSTLSENPFSLRDIRALNNYTASTYDDVYVGGYEYRNPYILSGVEFTDLTMGSNTFTIFNLDPSTASVTSPSNYLVNNPIILCKSKEDLPRLRFNLKDYGEFQNLLIPDHEFEVELRATGGTEDSKTLGGVSYGVWIHTDVEYDHHGNRIMWNYMPNGTWEAMDPARVSGIDGVSYVKTKLAHYLDFTETYTPSSESIPCFLTESNKDMLVDMREEDFISKTFKFNTHNQPIKVSLPYYQSKEQVHRENQNYIIEFFMDNTPADNLFGIIDYVSIKDTTQYDRVHHLHSFEYNNYEQSREVAIDDFSFIYKEGSQVPSGVYLWSDKDGNLTTSSGEKVTFKESDSYGFITSKVKLYSQVNLKTKSKWVVDSNSNQVFYPSRDHVGFFKVGASSTLDPSTFTITGKTLGSNIRESVTLKIPYKEEDTIGILREFNRLQKDVGSRDATKSSGRYGPQGGSRLNYRAALMWSQAGGHTTFESDDNQYTEIYLEN